MFRTILLAVDGSKYSEKAVECLGGVAERWPSIAWTIFTEAFSRIARDAAMCRRSWTQRPSVSLAAPRHAERGMVKSCGSGPGHDHAAAS
jgi:hypothetical protein